MTGCGVLQGHRSLPSLPVPGGSSSGRGAPPCVPAMGDDGDVTDGMDVPELREDECLRIVGFCSQAVGGAVCVWGPPLCGKSHCIRWCLAAAGVRYHDAPGHPLPHGNHRRCGTSSRVLWLDGNATPEPALLDALGRSSTHNRIVIVESRHAPPPAHAYDAVVALRQYTPRQLLALLPGYLARAHPNVRGDAERAAVQQYVAAGLRGGAGAATYATMQHHADESVAGGAIVPDRPAVGMLEAAAELSVGLAGALVIRKTKKGKVRVQRGAAGRSRAAVVARTRRSKSAVAIAAGHVAATRPVLATAMVQTDGLGLGTSHALHVLERRGVVAQTAQGDTCLRDPDIDRLMRHARRLGVLDLMPPS